ncbi:MAG: hypothetical protein ACR2OX_11565 [Methyloligellaceae bacterium]
MAFAEVPVLGAAFVSAALSDVPTGVSLKAKADDELNAHIKAMPGIMNFLYNIPRLTHSTFKQRSIKHSNAPLLNVPLKYCFSIGSPHDKDVSVADRPHSTRSAANSIPPEQLL